MTSEKLNGLIRLRLNGIMSAFNMYGLDVHVPMAIEGIVDLLEFYYTERSKIEDGE